jgi:hypothetical protein
VLLVDTNVLLDVVTSDPHWLDWSERQLGRLTLQTQLIINPVVYAELSIGFDHIDEVEAILVMTGVAVRELPRSALSWPARPSGRIGLGAAPRQGSYPTFS